MAGGVNNSLNMSNGDDYETLRWTNCIFYEFVVYTVVMGTVIVVGVVGNSLAFVVFWKNNIKTPASFLFQSLALVDLTVLLLELPSDPMTSFVTYTGWMQGYWLIHPYVIVCRVPLCPISLGGSIWIVVLIAVNRYIAVCFPFKALRWCTVSKVKKQLAFVLLLDVLLNIPQIFVVYIVYTTDDNSKSYSSLGVTTFGSSKLYRTGYTYAMHLIFVFALPISILTVLNIRIIKALKARRRNRTEMSTSRQQDDDNNVTFVLIIVVIVHIICHLPTCISYMTSNVAPYQAWLCGSYLFYLKPISRLLVMLNSAVNFFIYAVFNKCFRHVLTQTVYGCRLTGRFPQFSVANFCTASPQNGNDNDAEDTRF